MLSLFVFTRRICLCRIQRGRSSWRGVLDITLCDKVVNYGRSVVFSGYSVSSDNKTDCHDIAEILLKVALNTITLTFPTLKETGDLNSK